jgi:hypothetical protein
MTIAPKVITERNDIFSFPHGAIAGNCIHRIFESLDFSFANPEKERGRIRDSLSTYGIDAKWQEVLWDMAQRVVSLPLASSSPEFALKNIKAGHRLHELEFYFPLELITAQGLAAVLPAGGDRGIPTRMMQLGFSPVICAGLLIWSSGTATASTWLTGNQTIWETALKVIPQPCCRAPWKKTIIFFSTISMRLRCTATFH